MKKLILTVLMVLCLTVPALALEMPDLSVNGFLLYNMNTKQTTAAPGVTATLVTFANGIIKGEVGIAFPAQNDASTRSYVAGPIMGVDFVKLLEKVKGAEIVAKELKLTAGAGILVDVLHISGNAPKDWLIPALHIGFTF